MKQSNIPGVPDHFLRSDGVDPRVNAAVAEAIGAVGGAPKGWDAALQCAREAEFAWLKSTSLNLAEKVQEIEDTLATWKSRREGARGAAAQALDETIRQGEINLQHAREIAALVPEEASRIRVRRERADRAREYQRLFDDFHRREVAHEATSPAEAQTLIDLDAQVRADVAAHEAEQQHGRELLATVDEARAKARELLERAVEREIWEVARQCKQVVGSKAASYAAFPSHAPQEIGRAYSRARYLSNLCLRLDNSRIDVDALFTETVGADDWDLVCVVIRRQTGILPRSREVLLSSRRRATK